MQKSLNRRHFMRLLSAGLGASIAALNTSCNTSRGKWRFLSDEEGKLLNAVVDQIIPADEDAGAKDAGVVNYIDKQLVSFYKKHQDNYRVNLLKMQSAALNLHDTKFEAMEWNTQTEFLELMEKGNLLSDNWGGAEQRNFFRMVVDHCMQGFYGSPRHGGNDKYVSYRMLDLPYPDFISQNRYKNMDWRTYPTNPVNY
jgi:gluconate 2-dehydrogenase gamma chain